MFRGMAVSDSMVKFKLSTKPFRPRGNYRVSDSMVNSNNGPLQIYILLSVFNSKPEKDLQANSLGHLPFYLEETIPHVKSTSSVVLETASLVYIAFCRDYLYIHFLINGKTIMR